MRNAAMSVCLLVCASIATAEQTLLDSPWGQLKAQGMLKDGRILPTDDTTPFDLLLVENTEAKETRLRVLTLEKPPITSATYAIVGQVACEAVEGKGYLEMWTVTADGGKFFSRTLGGRGPMRHLHGTCAPRRFVLPFFAKRGSPPPTRLTVNVVLPGRGAVVLGPIALKQYDAGEDPLAQPGQWWTDRQGGMLGGIVGAAIGCIGGLVGLLAGSGRARSSVLGLMKAVFVLGLVALAFGVVALLGHQPGGVWYPLVLLGVLCSVLFGALQPSVRRRYGQAELRKMQAQDIA